MRALAYFRADPTAPRGDPANGAVLTRSFERFCASHGHVRYGVFNDMPTGDMPQFQQMLERIRTSNQAYLVIVPSVGHLGDSPRHQVARVLDLDALKCQVRCADPAAPEPLRAALQAADMGAQPGAGGHRQAVREGMKAKASLGLGLGKPSYGYRIGQGGSLESVAAEAEVVRSIFRMYLSDGLGVRAIARRLNDDGLSTRQGKAWTMVTVRDILRNSAYIGTYRRFGYRILGSHRAIVSAEEFRRAQDKMRSRTPRSRRRVTEPFLLTGLLYCGACGQRMMGVARHRAWRRKDGERVQSDYRYYQCQSRVNRNQCQYHTHHAANIEEQVLDALTLPAPDQPGLGGPAHGVGEITQEIEAQLRSLERRYVEWVRRAAAGLITLRQLRAAFHTLDTERQMLEEQLAVYTGDETRQREWAGGQLRRIESEWEGLGVVQRQQLVRSLVAKVVVLDGKVQVVPRMS